MDHWKKYEEMKTCEMKNTAELECNRSNSLLYNRGIASGRYGGRGESESITGNFTIRLFPSFSLTSKLFQSFAISLG